MHVTIGSLAHDRLLKFVWYFLLIDLRRWRQTAVENRLTSGNSNKENVVGSTECNTNTGFGRRSFLAGSAAEVRHWFCWPIQY
jgi:hypothetical protein